MAERMENYDLDMVNEYLEHNPQPSIESMENWIPIDFMLEHWMAFIDSDWEHKLEVFKKAGNCNIRGLPEKELKEITTKDIPQALRITGKVVGVSEPYAVPEFTEYKCRNCGDVVQSRKKQCCSEQDLELYIDPSHLIDVQVIKVQEAGHSQSPSRMAIVVKGKDMLWKVKHGKKVYSVGLVKFEQSNPRGPVMLIKHFEGYYLEQEERECDVRITPEFDEWMRNELEQPYFWDKFVGSFAPHIRGYREIKEALILLMLSASEDIPLNIWLVGDASTAKSQFLLYVARLHPNAHYISAAGASWPGLSAHAQQDADTKAWIIYPGTLAQADRGIFCFDEVHAVSETISASLNEAGEQKTVSYAKGGQSGTLPARCAWLFGSNTHYGDYNTQTDLQDNLQFLGKAKEALISRFPLIFIMRDVINEANDHKIALQILENRSNKAIERFKNDWTEYETIWDFLEDRPLHYYGSDRLMHIFAWFATKKQPKVEKEDYERLAEWYTEKRQKDKNYYSSKTKPRNFDKIVFLAELKAKALNKEVVDQSDIDYAVDLFNKSRDAAAFDPKTQVIDAGQLDGYRSRRIVDEEQTKDGQLWDAYEEVLAVKNAVTEKDWVNQLVEGKQWKEHVANKWIKRVKDGGLVIERVGGNLEKVKR